MSDYAVKRIDEMEAVYLGAFKRARAELGVESFGMAIIDLPPNFESYPEHDHSGDGQEEVFLALRGGGEIEIDGERFPLDADHVDPGLLRDQAQGLAGRRRGPAARRSAASRAGSTSRRRTRSSANPTRWRGRLGGPVRRLPVLLVALLAALVAAAPAAAAIGNESEDPVVVIVGDVTIEPEQVVEGVFLVNGHAQDRRPGRRRRRRRRRGRRVERTDRRQPGDGRGPRPSPTPAPVSAATSPTATRPRESPPPRRSRVRSRRRPGPTSSASSRSSASSSSGWRSASPRRSSGSSCC